MNIAKVSPTEEFCNRSKHINCPTLLIVLFNASSINCLGTEKKKAIEYPLLVLNLHKMIEFHFDTIIGKKKEEKRKS